MERTEESPVCFPSLTTARPIPSAPQKIILTGESNGRSHTLNYLNTKSVILTPKLTPFGYSFQTCFSIYAQRLNEFSNTSTPF